MTKLSTLLVAVRKISSSIPRSQFPEERIETLAQLILAAEGLINPLVLRRTSLESFQVIAGDLEYYAAVRAREIDLRKGEMINAFVLDSDNETILEQQVELLRSEPTISTPNSSDIDMRLTNIETRLETRLYELQQQQKSLKIELETKIGEIEQKLPEKIEPLQAFNQWDMEKLNNKLKKAGIQGKKLSDIIPLIIENRPYNSLLDIVEKVKIKRGNKLEKAISEKKLLEIIDNWN